MMKKFLQIALVLVISFCYVANVNAATKSDVVTYLTTSHKVAGKNVRISDGSITKVRRYFSVTDVSDSNATTIIKKLDQIIDVMNTAGVSDPNNLSKAKKQEIFAIAKEAAALASATLTYDASSNSIIVYKNGVKFDVFPVEVVYDSASGTYILGQSSHAKYTGNDYTVYAAISGLAIVLTATSLFRKLKVNA